MSACPLPPGNRVLEQGWLSANNVRLFDGDTATLVAGWRARDPRWSPRSPACVPLQTMACGWPAMRSACASPLRCWSDGAWISIACRGYLASVPLYQEANERFLGLSFGELVEWLLRELLGAGVATLEGQLLYAH